MGTITGFLYISKRKTRFKNKKSYKIKDRDLNKISLNIPIEEKIDKNIVKSSKSIDEIEKTIDNLFISKSLDSLKINKELEKIDNKK